MGWGWSLIRLFEAGRSLTFSAFGMGRLFEVGANSRLGAYSNKYGITESTTLDFLIPSLNLRHPPQSKFRLNDFPR